MPTTVLTVVTLSLKSNPVVSALSHVATSVSSYLDASMMIPLAQACSFGSIRLLDHIWHNSAPGAEGDKRWSLFQYLRTDIHYYRFQFAKSLLAAVKRGDLNIIKWVLRQFSGCTAGEEVVEQAACYGRLDVLKYLLQYSRCGLEKRNMIIWGGDDMANAIKGGHDEMARWLFENTPNTHRNLERVMKFAVYKGRMSLIMWLLDIVYVNMNKLDVLLPPPSLNDAAAGGHMDIVVWIFKQNFGGSSDCALEEAAKIGRLDMVQWLMEHGITKDARKALQAACNEGHLDIVQWILKHCRVSYPHFAMVCAIQRGNLNIVQHLYEAGIAYEPSRMMFNAASCGHGNVIRWLIGKCDTQLFFPSTPSFGGKQLSDSTMDRAAANGHLHVLKLLRTLVVEMQHAETTVGFTCSEWALLSGASNGHFEVVKWLCANYPHLIFPTSTSSMVARNGDLHMLQWLHNQANVTWCSDAMDLAAENGHLAVVKWLHENRTEGCTTNAMNYAARNGHLRIVRWLQLHRREGCTVDAIEFALEREHFEVILFLRAKYTEHCSAAVKILSRGRQKRYILQMLEEEYPADSLLADR